ncbi:NUDIX domain-containing protein [Streptomyces sp. NPDC002082]
MAVVVLTDRRGRILLRRRPDTAATWPGAWSYFGAAAKPGETMAAALQRSLTSKGIEVEDLRDLFLISDEATSRKVAVF